MIRFFGFDHPFFVPLWRRLAVIAVALGWGAIEIAMGAVEWGLLFVALGAIATYGLLIAYKSPDDSKTADTDD